MLDIGLRVLLVYMLLLISIRIMGKREIGQLSNLDFVVAIVVAELATLPITDHKLTLEETILPMLIITFLQVAVSILCLKSNRFRRLLYGRPNVLIAGGQMQMQEMRKARYNIDDLLSQLRQKDVFDIASVEYAVLETSGELTVMQKQGSHPVTRSDLKMETPVLFCGMPLTLIDDGEVNWRGLADHGITEAWLTEQLRRNGAASAGEVFYASLSQNGQVYLITRAEALKTREIIH